MARGRNRETLPHSDDALVLNCSQGRGGSFFLRAPALADKWSLPMGKLMPRVLLIMKNCLCFSVPTPWDSDPVSPLIIQWASMKSERAFKGFTGPLFSEA